MVFDGEADHTLNYNIRILGRKGVLVLNAIAGMNQLNSIKSEMQKVIAFTEFNKGNAYGDFDKSTDKTAEYGIAALVAGGVAAKLGLFGKLFALLIAFKKVLILGVIGIWIAVKNSSDSGIKRSKHFYMGKLLTYLLAAGKLGKVLTTGGTMLISMFAYSFVFGWKYAIGFVVLIFVHEMGHFVAARQRGLDVGAPTFIPFVGAWINMKEMPVDVETEAYVGFAGPIVGTTGALVCYWLSRTYDSNLLLALAYAGFMLNLFNLIPISPLDGGRITAIISPKVWLIGAPILAALFLYRPSPMLILIGIMAIPQIKMALQKDGGASKMPEGYYNVPTEARINYGVMYIGLAAFLAIMSHEVHNVLGNANF